LGELIEKAGTRNPVQAVFSGVSNPAVTAADLDVPISYEGFAAIGSGMGAAGFIVVDESRCMVDVAHQISAFLAIESCGQCPPCKLGSTEITARLERIRNATATSQDVAEMGGWLTRVTDSNRCYLGTEEQNVVRSMLTSFPDDVVGHLEAGGCGRAPGFLLPKLADIVDGHAVLVR
jgi:NADH:ubiquinone oxidoreductase subunit F (NADH-binding)